MVNLRQSISTLRKKGKDAVSSSSSPNANKFRKSVASPTVASKRMSTLGRFKTKNDETNRTEFDSGDLSSHIGEIKLSSPPTPHQFSSLQGFTLEEKDEEEDKEIDLARKTDLKLQERREQRRQRQEKLQKQLQLKLENSKDNTTPSLDDANDFALPLHMDSEESNMKPRVAGNRKSAMIRNRRAGELDPQSRESKVPGQRNSSSPGRRMSRRAKQMEGTEQQSNGTRPFSSSQKQLGGEHGTIPEADEDGKMASRRERRKGRKKEDSEGSLEVSPSPLGDRRRLDGQQVGLQNGQRRERRKTELGQRKSVRPKATGEVSQSSPGALSTSYRSGARTPSDTTSGRQRQSMRPRGVPALSSPGDLDTSTRSSLDASINSTGRAAVLDTSYRSTGMKARFNQADLSKAKGSWDEGNDQRGLSSQSEHRTAATRRKRREKMEEQNNALNLHKSEHGHTGARAAKRKTIGVATRHNQEDETKSPQSDTRRQRRESETLRTNRSLDDTLGFTNLHKSPRKKEKSNGVRFSNDVKDNSEKSPPEKSTDERWISLKSAGGKPKAKVEKQNNRSSAMKNTSSNIAPNQTANKAPKGENSKERQVWDDEYEDKSALKKTQFVIEQSSSNDISTRNALDMEDASDSQYDFEFEEPSRNRRPDFESGEEWLQPVATDIGSGAEGMEALKHKIDQIESAELPEDDGEAIGDVAKAKLPKKSNQDFEVDENSSSSGSEFSSSAETEEIPTEVPVKNTDFSKRVSQLNPHGDSSGESESDGSSESDDDSDSSGSSESSSSSEESAAAGEIPAVVSVEDSMDELDGDISSASSNSRSENGSQSGKKGEANKPKQIANVLGEQILPSSLRDNLKSEDEAPLLKHNVDAKADEVENNNANSIPSPPPPPPPEPDNMHVHLMPEDISSDGTFDDIFSNEITALEGTLQNMGDLTLTPAPSEALRKKTGNNVPPMNDIGKGPTPKEGAQWKQVVSNPAPSAVDRSEKGSSASLEESQPKSNGKLQPQSSSGDYQFFMDILGLIASPSPEQRTLMESNPTMSKEVLVAAAKHESQNRQRLKDTVEVLESKISALHKDLQKQQLETGTHKIQVATQDLILAEYKDSVETLTEKCQTLEKETASTTLQFRQQEEKNFKMMEKLEETNQLLKEQQMFMNAQQRQMQTMEAKIASFQVARDREEIKMSIQNEKLREIIRIQKETILKALGEQEA
ncbi:MAG: hypothetical protein SGBAC_009535 [Bacillariaceae sp.]